MRDGGYIEKYFKTVLVVSPKYHAGIFFEGLALALR
jgi:hypothetical protein